MLRKSVLLLLCAFWIIPIWAQSTITKAMIGNVEINTNECSAIVEVLNKGNSDITGFVLSMDATYSSGKKEHAEHTEEYGPQQTAENKALHPGKISRVFVQFSPPNNDLCLDIRPSIVVAVDSAQTAQATDNDAYDRFVSDRKASLRAYQHSADMIKKAISDPSTAHPSADAIDSLNESLVQQTMNGKKPDSPDKGFVTETVKQLKDAQTKAAKEGKSERQVLQEMLKDKQDRAKLYTNYVNIRREQ